MVPKVENKAPGNVTSIAGGMKAKVVRLEGASGPFYTLDIDLTGSHWQARYFDLHQSEVVIFTPTIADLTALRDAIDAGIKEMEAANG